MTAKDINQLILEKFIVEDENLKINQLDTFRYFRHKDGRILVFLESYPEEIKSFSSLEEFERIRKVALDSLDSEHILEKYQQDLKKFSSTLIATQRIKLSNLLSIDSSKLDYSFESLVLIDDLLRKNIYTRENLIKLLYFPLFLYSGEFIKNELNGEWILSKNGVYLEPMIRSGKRRLLYFIDLFNELNENYENFSLAGTAKIQIYNY